MGLAGADRGILGSLKTQWVPRGGQQGSREYIEWAGSGAMGQARGISSSLDYALIHVLPKFWGDTTYDQLGRQKGPGHMK